MKKFTLSVRRLHRYLMALIGIQVLIWMLSGLYMVVFDIDYIRGDHLAKPLHFEQQRIAQIKPLSFIYQQYPVDDEIKLLPFIDNIAYSFKSNGQAQLIDSASGQSLLPISETQIRRLALAQYTFVDDEIIDLVYLEKKAPSELAARHLPVWRVEFASLFNNTLYVSATTGQVVTKRHVWWRVFDVFWMLHIMDYQTRSDVSNWLLRLFSTCFILAIGTGIMLVVDRFKFIKRVANQLLGERQ